MKTKAYRIYDVENVVTFMKVVKTLKPVYTPLKSRSMKTRELQSCDDSKARLPYIFK